MDVQVLSDLAWSLIIIAENFLPYTRLYKQLVPYSATVNFLDASAEVFGKRGTHFVSLPLLKSSLPRKTVNSPEVVTDWPNATIILHLY